MGLSVLLVEDDYDLAEAVVGSLELEGIACDHAADGLLGLELAGRNTYDVLLLDITIPRLNGLGLCERLRRQAVNIPILMLTARDALGDKIAGFEAGTDDYLTKPFDMEELLARIRALSKRYSRQCRVFTVADLEINLDTHQAVRNRQTLHLTPTEWRLLELLASHSPRVVPRNQLEQALWGDGEPSESSLKVYLSKLRKKVDPPALPPLIHTVTGVGVVMKEDDGHGE